MAEASPAVPPWRNPKLRSVLYQVVLCAALAALAFGAIRNAAENLARAQIASGFGFWNQPAGFDDYSAASSYGRAFWVGLLNTLLVAGLGIALATVLGFVVGVARLSRNFLVERLASGYVELIRNVPLLLQLLFWYNAVLRAAPEFRDSVRLPGGGFLNNRGLFLPRPEVEDGSAVLLAFAAGVAAAILYRLLLRRRAGRVEAGWLETAGAVLLVIAPPLFIFLAAGPAITFSHPELGRFNIRGGVEILPEFVALLAGLVIYTAAFIAEVVRAGVLAVPKGQTEAAYALGLRRGSALRLVVIPQAMRVIVPPLTNQYLNLTKNSSLAVAIGYPDLVQIFAGTVLNQTGQAVEVVAVTMAVYLTISLATSLMMNWYNARIARAERAA
jgi:general L-amino acid transport system permease protein